MQNIKKAILTDFQLKDRLNCSVECYLLKKRRFLVFIDDIVTNDNEYSIADKIIKSLDDGGIKGGINNCKTIIVVAYTNEFFKPNYLSLYNNINTFVEYILINQQTKEVYYRKNIIPEPFAFGLSCGSLMKRIYRIVTSVIN